MRWSLRNQRKELYVALKAKRSKISLYTYFRRRGGKNIFLSFSWAFCSALLFLCLILCLSLTHERVHSPSLPACLFFFFKTKSTPSPMKSGWPWQRISWHVLPLRRAVLTSPCGGRLLLLFCLLANRRLELRQEERRPRGPRSTPFDCSKLNSSARFDYIVFMWE